MTVLHRVGICDNFKFRGGGSIISASLRGALVGNAKKRWNVCTVMVLLYIYNKMLGVGLPVCPVIKNKVLMLIKVCVVYIPILSFKVFSNRLISNCQATSLFDSVVIRVTYWVNFGLNFYFICTCTVHITVIKQHK